MSKRGQFYLIAAVIIIGLVISLVVVTNTFLEKEEVRVDDLKEELIIESNQVLDYKTNQKDDVIKNFTDSFYELKGSGTEIVFIYGDKNNINAYKYNSSGNESVDVNTNDDWINLTIDGNNYGFVLNAGENFYFIISQKSGGEKYVTTN